VNYGTYNSLTSCPPEIELLYMLCCKHARRTFFQLTGKVLTSCKTADH